MRRLLLSTATLGAAALAAPAWAQDLFRGQASPDEILASDLMGMRVYASETAVDATEVEGPGEGWEDIGEVGDLVLGRDGSVEAVLVDIGGFLGIGERQTAISMGALRFVSDSATAEDVGDYFLVVNASRANLEDAPDYASARAAEGAQETAAAVEGTSEATSAAGTVPTEEVTTIDSAAALTESETEAADTAAAATGAATGAAAGVAAGAAAGAVAATDEAAGGGTEARTEVAEDGTTVTTVTPEGEAAMETATETATAEAAAAEGAGRTPIAREGYVAATAETMTADALQGAAVYDSADERVGEVGEILIDDAGQITDVVVDVGGFLGIGEKAVALPMASLDVLQQEGGDDLRVYVSQTEDELEAMDTYAAE